mmetsp:Transcript_19656/g.27100  ORF Transcript_19656/g.27100 Transcript_19656/m.27100 type:complete len:183 (+) Transcript_19656:36-584(+)
MPSSSENGPSSEPEKKQEEEPSTKRRKITPRIDLGEVTDKNIGQLKLLNSVIFPVQYRETFYKDVLAFPELTRLAFYNSDILAGAVCCREIVEEGTPKLYIMTLGVLAAYRNHGIGSILLEFVLNKICKERPHIKQVYLHVQVSNDVAIEFYKKFGFEVGKKIENYYRRIEPADCFLVQKDL